MMDRNFIRKDLYSWNENVFQLLDKDWMLVTAGISGNYNMMTASWGGFGILWHKPVAFVFIRPQRYTFNFAEKNDYLTLSFFEEKYRSTLQLLGTKSGRDINKMNVEGLTPFVLSSKAIAFCEARVIIECRKLYFSDIKPENFVIPEIDKNYPQKDYHRMYICEIINFYQKK